MGNIRLSNWMQVGMGSSVAEEAPLSTLWEVNMGICHANSYEKNQSIQKGL
jgi:hypothetical protein